MEGNARYFARRAAAEHAAARTALTENAKARRLTLARSFEAKLAALLG